MTGQLDAIKFRSIAFQNGICVPKDAYRLTERTEITVETFESMFGPGPYTHSGLMSTSYAQTSWKDIFDDWLAKGFIS